jgi:hypothetical protein
VVPNEYAVTLAADTGAGAVSVRLAALSMDSTCTVRALPLVSEKNSTSPAASNAVSRKFVPLPVTVADPDTNVS